MHRQTYFSALFLAFALGLQSTAQTVCEAVCVGVTESGSSPSTVTSEVPSQKCHSVEQPNSMPSASLVPDDDECRHAAVARSVGAERISIRAELVATAFLLSSSFAQNDVRSRPAITDRSHAPPKDEVAAIVPLRL